MALRAAAHLTACSRIAATQYGLVSRPQAIEAGLSEDAVDRLLAEGVWRSLRPRVYALWTPVEADARFRHRLMGAALWLGDRSAVSHRAAALLLSIEGVEAAPAEFTTEKRRRTPDPGLVLHRVRSLRGEDLMAHDGFTVTTPARTLADLAPGLRIARLEAAVESALRRGLASEQDIQCLLDRSGRTKPGRGKLEHVLAMLPKSRTESYLETKVWQIFAFAGLRPTRQYRVRDERGVIVARPDFAFVEQRLAIEVDGYGSHSSLPDWKRDRAHQNTLTRLGWRIYHVTWEDVKLKGNAIVAEVLELLTASQPSFSSPTFQLP